MRVTRLLLSEALTFLSLIDHLELNTKGPIQSHRELETQTQLYTITIPFHLEIHTLYVLLWSQAKHNLSTPALTVSYVSLTFFPQTSAQVPEESNRPLNPRQAGKPPFWGWLHVNIYACCFMDTMLNRWKL